MLRLIAVVAVFALVTLPLMPVQWAAVGLKRPLRRRIPVLYHRFVCRLLGIRVRLNGAPVAARPLLIVANHASWLDISIITSLAPVVFFAAPLRSARALPPSPLRGRGLGHPFRALAHLVATTFARPSRTRWTELWPPCRRFGGGFFLRGFLSEALA